MTALIGIIMGSTGLAFCYNLKYHGSMSRPIRIEFAGALYHVTSRGGRKEDIYIQKTRPDTFLVTPFC